MSRTARMTRAPRIGTHEGAPAVFVPLQDGAEAITTPEGYAAVQATGCTGLWTINAPGKGAHSHVRTHPPVRGACRSGFRSVAALIAGVDRDHQTTYMNGNRLDLRPCNLAVTGRWGIRGPAPLPSWDDA